jgi:hypothetical protein
MYTEAARLRPDEMPGLAGVAAIVPRSHRKGREREPGQCQDWRAVVSEMHNQPIREGNRTTWSIIVGKADRMVAKRPHRCLLY